jgi:NodT family efflux transporter outer membrane factor (OMF) lipoprotein
MTNTTRISLCLSCCVLSACAAVGPEFVQPETPLGPEWYQAERAGYSSTADDQVRWWKKLNDPVLDQLVEAAQAQNNSVRIAGLRVLESRAQLGIATGNRYPQTQVLAGDATAVQASKNAANTAAGDLSFTQFNVGAGASWEIDFWGKFRRGIEAADAAYLASIAGYDQVMVLVTAQVCGTYLAIRTLEEQLAITRDNIALQQRSYDIVYVQFENGSTSELDVLQARTQLLSTQSSIPQLQSELYQAQHAMTTLLGLAPADTRNLLGAKGSIPTIPEETALGLPADLLRRRPDVRQAEYFAMAQNASVGLATANLYPSFSLNATLGLGAAGSTDTTRTGKSGIGQLFNTDSVTYAFGPSFVWPFLNYGRIKNSVRVQDARLQQALIAYKETALQAAREVEDAIVALEGARHQDVLLGQTVTTALRSTDVAMIRFNEGFADYQRVLSAQQALFAQQSRYVSNRSKVVSSYISLYLALGGGWQVRFETDLLDAETRGALTERTDWGDVIEAAETDSRANTTGQAPIVEKDYD